LAEELEIGVAFEINKLNLIQVPIVQSEAIKDGMRPLGWINPDVQVAVCIQVAVVAEPIKRTRCAATEAKIHRVTSSFCWPNKSAWFSLLWIQSKRLFHQLS
jgi:hypothetical protein